MNDKNPILIAALLFELIIITLCPSLAFFTGSMEACNTFTLQSEESTVSLDEGLSYDSIIATASVYSSALSSLTVNNCQVASLSDYYTEDASEFAGSCDYEDDIDNLVFDYSYQDETPESDICEATPDDYS